jgi:hypothetical protein
VMNRLHRQRKNSMLRHGMVGTGFSPYISPELFGL